MKVIKRLRDMFKILYSNIRNLNYLSSRLYAFIPFEKPRTLYVLYKLSSYSTSEGRVLSSSMAYLVDLRVFCYHTIIIVIGPGNWGIDTLQPHIAFSWASIV